MGSSSKEVTVGYKYLLGLHMVLCHGPIDKLVAIDVDEKRAWTGPSTGGTFVVDAEELFGGEEREGGVSGEVTLLMGDQAQVENAYLQSQLGDDIPAYRGVVSAVLNGVYIGLSPYLKRWAFWAERIHVRYNGSEQWYDTKAAIGNDMNPAHIIRECLTDPEWGMGYPEADVDDTAFTIAADQLFDETMGISLLWDKSVVLEEFLQLILKHVDGSLYVDRTSGKFVLKLARGGYDIDDLLVLDENNVERITDYKRNTIGELVNSVTVIYWDAERGQNNSITVQDIALAAQQQATIGTTKQFPGFTNGTIASRVASRALKALSVPLASATIYANRVAAGLNVGDVFVLSWPRYGLTQTVMRVASIELGSLSSNLVKIACVEDVFAISSAIYAPPPPTEWTDPNNPPAPSPFHNVIEAPYWEVVQRRGETQAQALTSDAGFVLVTGVRPTSDATNAKIWTNPTNSLYEEAGTVDFCPTALATSDVTRTDTVITIDTGVDIDIVRPNTYGVWGNEIVLVTAISSSSMTIKRGCLDTIPITHADNSRIYFSDTVFESDNIEYVDSEIARIKLLPITGKGTLLIGSATEQTVTMTSRQTRPYAPGSLKLNGAIYPDSIASTVDLVVNWKHRDRLQQTATLIDSFTNTDIGPEVGTTYTVELRTQAGALISTATGLTGTTHTFTVATVAANYGRLRVILWSLRDGYTSHSSFDFEFTRSGYGTGYGYSYGGI